MTQIKLSYFDFDGGRGQDCRLALHIAGVEFEDDRVKGKDWPARKPDAPFGAMPILEIEGEGRLAQSNAILGLIGSRYGLLPANDFEAARHRALLSAGEELRDRVNRTSALQDEEDKKSAREALADGYMRHWSNNVDKQIAGPFVGGDEVSVADLKLYVLMTWFKKGGVDHIPPTYFDDFSKLAPLYEAVAAHPKVVEWNERRRAAKA